MSNDFSFASSRAIVWDVETGPLPDSYLDMIAPEFTAPSNYKDEDKIAANIAEQKVKWKERAALSPMTGKVLCIAMRDIDGSVQVLDGQGDESTLLADWGRIVAKYRNEAFIGFNCKTFDIPFLIKRCWKLGVQPFLRPGVNLNRLDNWIDLRDTWQLGDRQAEGSLDAISKFLGVGAKNGSGKDFAGLWESDRDAALAYAINDINLTYAVAQKLGVIV
jgi:DNA polymerase elongation subunit (family B)